MAVTNADLQRLWDDAWDAAPDGANTFREQLRIFEKQIGNLVSQGSLQSFSKNSQSHSYAFTPRSLTQTDLARAWRTLITLFDRISTDLTDAGETATDEAIYAEGKLYLRDEPCECRTDFTEARC